MKRLLFRLFFLCSLGAVLGVVFLSLWSHLSFQAKYRAEPSSEFVLEEKETLSSLARRLHEEKFITHPFLFKALVRLKHNYKSFQAGRYLFLLDDSPEDIAEKMKKGETYNEVVLKITLPEGFSISQVISRLRENGYEKEELESLSMDKSFLEDLGLLSSSLEGYLYPSTYTFYNERPSVKKIYEEMVGKFFSKLPEGYLKRLKARGLTLEESVIVASLIEKETSLPEERPLISEVIFNRLKRGMTLGIDASVMYGIKNFSGNLTLKDLRNKKNPYNTRVHRGLPPGPICSPTNLSLEAVINPSEEGYLYYVLKPGAGQKAHQFSRSLTEHNKHVKKLLGK